MSYFGRPYQTNPNQYPEYYQGNPSYPEQYHPELGRDEISQSKRWVEGGTRFDYYSADPNAYKDPRMARYHDYYGNYDQSRGQYDQWYGQRGRQDYEYSRSNQLYPQQPLNSFPNYERQRGYEEIQKPQEGLSPQNTGRKSDGRNFELSPGHVDPRQQSFQQSDQIKSPPYPPQYPRENNYRGGYGNYNYGWDSRNPEQIYEENQNSRKKIETGADSYPNQQIRQYNPQFKEYNPDAPLINVPNEYAGNFGNQTPEVAYNDNKDPRNVPNQESIRKNSYMSPKNPADLEKTPVKNIANNFPPKNNFDEKPDPQNFNNIPNTLPNTQPYQANYPPNYHNMPPDSFFQENRTQPPLTSNLNINNMSSVLPQDHFRQNDPQIHSYDAQIQSNPSNLNPNEFYYGSYNTGSNFMSSGQMQPEYDHRYGNFVGFGANPHQQAPADFNPKPNNNTPLDDDRRGFNIGNLMSGGLKGSFNLFGGQSNFLTDRLEGTKETMNKKKQIKKTEEINKEDEGEEDFNNGKDFKLENLKLFDKKLDLECQTPNQDSDLSEEVQKLSYQELSSLEDEMIDFDKNNQNSEIKQEVKQKKNEIQKENEVLQKNLFEDKKDEQKKIEGEEKTKKEEDEKKRQLIEQEEAKKRQLIEEEAKKLKLIEEEEKKKLKLIEEEEKKKQQLIEQEAKKLKLIEEEEKKKQQEQKKEELIKQEKNVNQKVLETLQNEDSTKKELNINNKNINENPTKKNLLPKESQIKKQKIESLPKEKINQETELNENRIEQKLQTNSPNNKNNQIINKNIEKINFEEKDKNVKNVENKLNSEIQTLEQKRSIKDSQNESPFLQYQSQPTPNLQSLDIDISKKNTSKLIKKGKKKLKEKKTKKKDKRKKNEKKIYTDSPDSSEKRSSSKSIEIVNKNIKPLVVFKSQKITKPDFNVKKVSRKNKKKEREEEFKLRKEREEEFKQRKEKVVKKKMKKKKKNKKKEKNSSKNKLNPNKIPMKTKSKRSLKKIKETQVQRNMWLETFSQFTDSVGDDIRSQTNVISPIESVNSLQISEPGFRNDIRVTSSVHRKMQKKKILKNRRNFNPRAELRKMRDLEIIRRNQMLKKLGQNKKKNMYERHGVIFRNEDSSYYEYGRAYPPYDNMKGYDDYYSYPNDYNYQGYNQYYQDYPQYQNPGVRQDAYAHGNQNPGQYYEHYNYYRGGVYRNYDYDNDYYKDQWVAPEVNQKINENPLAEKNNENMNFKADPQNNIVSGADGINLDQPKPNEPVSAPEDIINPEEKKNNELTNPDVSNINITPNNKINNDIDAAANKMNNLPESNIDKTKAQNNLPESNFDETKAQKNPLITLEQAKKKTEDLSLIERCLHKIETGKLQRELKEKSKEEKIEIFKILKPDLLKICCDNYGKYVMRLFLRFSKLNFY